MAAEVDEEHREAMRTIEDDLVSALPTRDDTSAGRRSFLRGAGFSGLVVAVGGLTLSLDAMVHSAAAQTGTTTTQAGTTTSGAPTTTTTLPPRQPSADDRALLGFIQSLELTAVAAYGIALDSKKLSDATGTVAQIFQAHHRQHAQATGSLAGAAAPNVANASLVAAFGPKFQSAADEKSLLQLAYQVENAAVATYAAALAKITGTDPAAVMASILPIESRHAIVLGQAMGLGISDLAPTIENLGNAATPDKNPIGKG
jgi:rubrerythrin